MLRRAGVWAWRGGWLAGVVVVVVVATGDDGVAERLSRVWHSELSRDPMTCALS